MNILWLCNVEIPIISDVLNTKKCNFGGWLDQISRQIIMENNKITIIYPSKKKNNYSNDILSFYSFVNIKDLDIIVNEKLDLQLFNIIHIWGTEYSYTNYFLKKIKENGLIENTIISLQGFASICSKHYTEGLPNSVINRFTLRDLIKFQNIKISKYNFEKNGKFEIETLKNTKNVIGRTRFDKAISYLINPNINYYFCNETLRNSFYQKVWDISKIRRHSIFVSQCNYPIKGFHNLLKIFPLILEKFPDAHIYTTGKDLFNLSFKDKLKITSYQKYLLQLIKKYKLKNNVTFLGELDENQMLEQYLLANVFCSTSNIENSPNSVGEAMLIGCPVVASYVGGTMDLLIDNVDGLLYQSTANYMLAYNIMKILSNDELALKFSVNSRAHAKETHSIKKNYSQLMNIYKSIIKRTDE